MIYDASSIKIKEYATDIWSMAISLQEEYGHDPDWIQTGLEACDIAHVPHSYFINRYLKQDGTDQNYDVSKAFSEQLKLKRNKQQLPSY